MRPEARHAWLTHITLVVDFLTQHEPNRRGDWSRRIATLGKLKLPFDSIAYREWRRRCLSGSPPMS